LEYKYENGRRYHAYHEGKYVLPNDEQEQDRLDMLHHIFRLILDGGHYRAPLKEHKPQRVLDMGTGTGIWPIDFSHDFPEAVVIGTDLSAIQPTWVPPNVKFYVDDLESDWAYPEAEHFDYIHGRALIGSITDWKKLFSEAFNHLKPGGFIEIQEYPCAINSDDNTQSLVPSLMDWVAKLNEGCAKIGKPGNNAHLLKGYLEEAGFVDVRQEIYKVSRMSATPLRCLWLLTRLFRFLLGSGQKAAKIKNWVCSIMHNRLIPLSH
jgi:trans-aconitate methyltransferase